MSFDQNDYPSAANLIGNTNVPRVTLPIIRASARRLDPDGSSTVPYYASASGKTLSLEYTNEVATVVTVQTVDVVLSGNSLATIISDINTAGAGEVDALDLDGFLAIRNLSSGKTHYLKVLPFGTPASDAAPILGFEVDPFPGSVSFAGELEAAPGGRTQSNPKTTALIAKDSGLSARELNRPLAAILEMVEDLRADLSRDVIVYKTVSAVFSSGVWQVNDNNYRLYCPAINTPDTTDLEPYFQVLTTTRAHAVQNTTNYPSVRVSAIHYGTPVDFASSFVAWGTPDGKFATGTTVANKDKHAATAITSIKGNIIHCAGATFETALVKAGDPVELDATILQPFDHSGWWAVDAVIDETHLALRPMSRSVDAEPAPAAGNRPRVLNPDAGGTLRVAVGRFLPAEDLFISITDSSVTNMRLRIPVAVPLREVIAQDNPQSSGFMDQLALRLYTFINDHITDTADAHASTAISGFTSAQAWADGSFPTGSTLKTTIEDLIADLAASAGAARIGFGGSGAWADGETNPATTIEAQLDKIVTDLSGTTVGDSGAHKVGVAARSAWLGGRTNVAATLYAAIDKIITDLAVTTASDDGAERIGAQVTGDLAAGSVRSQLDELATNWGKLSRNNVWTAMQSFLASLATAADARGARLDVDYSGTHEQTLLLQSTRDSGSGPAFRLYMSSAGELSLTFNAALTGADTWTKDATTTAAYRFLMSGTSNVSLMHRDSTDTSTWSTANWSKLGAFAGATQTTMAAPNAKPLLQFYDYGGRRRVAFDHLGVQPRRVSEYVQSWIAQAGTATNGGSVAGWTVTTLGGVNAVGTGVQVKLSNTGSGIPGWMVDLNLSNVNTPDHVGLLFKSPDLLWAQDLVPNLPTANRAKDCVHILEWDAALYEVTTTVDPVVVRMGFSDDLIGLGLPTPSGYSAQFYIEADGLGGPYEIKFSTSNGGAPTVTSTGVNASTTQATWGYMSFRIELFGDGHPLGKHACAYINGNLVAVHTATIPIVNGPLGAIVYVDKDFSSTGGSGMKLGSVRYQMIINSDEPGTV